MAIAIEVGPGVDVGERMAGLLSRLYRIRRRLERDGLIPEAAGALGAVQQSQPGSSQALNLIMDDRTGVGFTYDADCPPELSSARRIPAGAGGSARAGSFPPCLDGAGLSTPAPSRGKFTEEALRDG